MARSIRRRILRPLVVASLMLVALAALSPAVSAFPGGHVAPRPVVIQQVAPDLVVVSVQQGWSPYGGYYSDAVVRNQGNDNAGMFYVSNQGAFLPVYGLNAGASATVRFYRSSNCETGGTVVADAFGQVWESNEYNNSRAWSIIC